MQTYRSLNRSQHLLTRTLPFFDIQSGLKSRSDSCIILQLGRSTIVDHVNFISVRTQTGYKSWAGSLSAISALLPWWASNKGGTIRTDKDNFCTHWPGSKSNLIESEMSLLQKLAIYSKCEWLTLDLVSCDRRQRWRCQNPVFAGLSASLGSCWCLSQSWRHIAIRLVWANYMEAVMPNIAILIKVSVPCDSGCSHLPSS